MYYLYRHIRLDTNTVFYIGIGTKYNKGPVSRMYKRAYAKTNRNKHWMHIVEKHGYAIEVTHESKNYDYIKSLEIEHIQYYGRRDLSTGSLCNMTDGGEGCFNIVTSEETRAKQSNAKAGKPLSDYHVSRIKEGFTSDVKSIISSTIKKTRELGLLNNTKHLNDPNFRSKMSSSVRRSYVDNPELRELVGKRFSRRVINKDTGEVFDSMKKAAIFENLSYGIFKRRFHGGELNYKCEI